MAQPTKVITKRQRVFVVHGRNTAARNTVFGFLRKIGLEPIEWSEAVNMTGSASPYIGDVLRSAFQHAQAVVVVMTGDDEARLREIYATESDWLTSETDLTPQARPNVLFEAGMALASHANRTLLLQFGEIRGFSDVAGRHVVRMKSNIECRVDIANRLRKAGCPVDIEEAKKARPRFGAIIAASGGGPTERTTQDKATEERSKPADQSADDFKRLTPDGERLLKAMARAWPKDTAAEKIPRAMTWPNLKAQHHIDELLDEGCIIRFLPGILKLTTWGKKYLAQIGHFD